MIQDYIIMAVEIVFIIALVPTVVGNSHPPQSTNLLTASGLSVLAGVILSLELWFGGTCQAVGAALWWAIAYRKWRQRD